MSLPRDIFGTSRINFQLKIIWKWVMIDLFHHILIFHYTMNQKFDLRSLYMVASYVTLAIADNRCGLMTENNAKQQKQFSNDYYI